MSAAPTGPDFPPLVAAEAKAFRQLAGMLRLGGGTLLLCAALQFALAFAGYAPPRKVNWDLGWGATVTAFAGVFAVGAGRSLGRSVAGGGDKAALVEAVAGLKNLFLVGLVLLGLATVGLVARTVQFFVQVARGDSGWSD